jgi:hypothetical protein
VENSPFSTLLSTRPAATRATDPDADCVWHTAPEMRIESDRRATELRRQTTATLILLTVQFVLGMLANLFVMLPTDHPGAGPGPYFSGALQGLIWSFSSGVAVLILHVVLGILLLLNGIRLIEVAVRGHRRAAVWFASVGLFGVLFAGINGASYLKYNENVSSMLMAAGFALAVGAYTLLLNAA